MNNVYSSDGFANDYKLELLLKLKEKASKCSNGTAFEILYIQYINNCTFTVVVVDNMGISSH